MQSPNSAWDDQVSYINEKLDTLGVCDFPMTEMGMNVKIHLLDVSNI